MMMLLLTSSFLVAAAAPVLEGVTLNPTNPTKLSTIAFTAHVLGTDIQEVKIGVLECNATTGICQNNVDNITMIHLVGTTYKANVTLDYPTASYITYWVYVETGGQWMTLPDSHGVKLNLTVNSGDGNHNGNGNGKSPGFELIVLVVAVGISIFLIGRKRFR
jgi:hypothetical protein